MFVPLMTLIAAAWSALIADALVQTAGAGDGSLVVLRRTFALSSSARVWMVAALAMSVVLVWAVAMWSSGRERPRRRRLPALESPAHGDRRVLMARLTAMQLRVEDLQERLRTATSERSELRAQVKRFRERESANVIVLEDRGPSSGSVDARTSEPGTELDTDGERERLPKPS